MTARSRTWKGLPAFSGTGIGSVPFHSLETASGAILSQDRLIPFWPQMVRVSPREDMLLQYSPPLPCLQANSEDQTLEVDPRCNRPQALLEFYEKFMAADPDYFSLRPDHASGFFRLLEITARGDVASPWLKGQVVGPITLGLSARLEGNRYLIHEPDLMDAAIKGLASQAVAQISSFRAAGKKSLLFIDEPSLSGYGSAFTPLARNEVLEILGLMIGLIREKEETLIGLHCCGNTDWGLLLELDLDLINLDSFGYGDSFGLYPRQIKTFLEQDRGIAWGLVPTTGFTGRETSEFLLDSLGGHLKKLIDSGLDRERLLAQNLLTPACGMGTLTEEAAAKLLNLLNRICHEAPEHLNRII